MAESVPKSSRASASHHQDTHCCEDEEMCDKCKEIFGGLPALPSQPKTRHMVDAISFNMMSDISDLSDESTSEDDYSQDEFTKLQDRVALVAMNVKCEQVTPLSTFSLPACGIPDIPSQDLFAQENTFPKQDAEEEEDDYDDYYTQNNNMHNGMALPAEYLYGPFNTLTSLRPAMVPMKRKRGRPPKDPRKLLQYHDQSIIPPPPMLDMNYGAYNPSSAFFYNPPFEAGFHYNTIYPNPYQEDINSPEINSAEAVVHDVDQEDRQGSISGEAIQRIIHHANTDSHNASESSSGIFKEYPMEGDKSVQFANFLANNIDSLLTLSTKVDISLQDFRNSTLGGKVRQKFDNLRTLKKAVEMGLIGEQQFKEKQVQFLNSFTFVSRNQRRTPSPTRQLAHK